MVKPGWEKIWPRLRDEVCKETSVATEEYNCVAFGTGDTSRWWEPWVIPPRAGIYWPAGVTPDNTLEAWEAAYATEGFERCTDGALEEGFVKVAIYADILDVPQHVARQLPDGRWASKLGDLEDIEHDTLEALEGGDYGEVALFLKRSRRDGDP